MNRWTNDGCTHLWTHEKEILTKNLRKSWISTVAARDQDFLIVEERVGSKDESFRICWTRSIRRPWTLLTHPASRAVSCPLSAGDCAHQHIKTHHITRITRHRTRNTSHIITHTISLYEIFVFTLDSQLGERNTS